MTIYIDADAVPTVAKELIIKTALTLKKSVKMLGVILPSNLLADAYQYQTKT